MRPWLKLGFSAAVITLLVTPMTAHGQNGTDRPFKATLTGAAHWGFPGVSPSNCTIATTFTDATGQATHMGRVVMSSSHCPGEPAYVNDGRTTITAANGDMLFGLYDYDPTSTSHAIPVTWVGGTGRLAEAWGSAVLEFAVVQQFKPGCTPVPSFQCFDFSVPWPWTATLVGTISY